MPINQYQPELLRFLVATGTDQATAFPLIDGNAYHEFTIVAAGTGARLPVPTQPLPMTVLVRNAGASTLTIYPPVGGTIDGGSVNAPTTVATSVGASYWAADPLTWYTVSTGGGAGGGGGGGGTVPTFSSFAISGQSTSLEVGSTIAAGSKTFTWTTTTSGSVAPGTISITDTTAGSPLATGLNDTSSDAITIGAITHTAAASQTWTIAGQDTSSNTFARTFTVSWFWRAYWGFSASATLDSAAVVALASSGLVTGVGGTFAIGATGFKYFAVPLSFTQPSSFKNALNGFNVPMADATSNAAYSSVNASGINFAPVSVTNSAGTPVTATYAVYRSKNASAGTLNLIVG